MTKNIMFKSLQQIWWLICWPPASLRHIQLFWFLLLFSLNWIKTLNCFRKKSIHLVPSSLVKQSPLQNICWYESQFYNTCENKYFPDFIGVIKPCLGVNKVNDQDISCFTLFIIYQFSHGKKKSCIYIHECIVVTMTKWWWNCLQTMDK